MSCVYPRETKDWQVGDRAYCVREVGGLVRGKVYRVASVIHIRGIAHTGLTFEGVPNPRGTKGFYSNKVIRLSRGESSLRQIDAGTEYTMRHYWPACYPEAA